jgi:hypothetical protein
VCPRRQNESSLFLDQAISIKEILYMPGTKYTDKQERKADHIAEGYEKKGVSKKEAESRAWATVNKQDGGGKKPGGSGRKGAKKKD